MLEIMDKISMAECKICFDKYKNPHILPCQHSFCKVCTDNLSKQNKVVCPLCSHVCAKDKVKPNYALEEAIEFIKVQADQLKHKDNQLAELTKSLGKSLDDTKTSGCQICDCKSIEFKCNNCDLWICHDCKHRHLRVSATKNHVIEKLEMKNEQIKSDILMVLSLLKSVMENKVSCIKRLDDAVDLGKSSKADRIRKSKDLRKLSHEEIDSHFDKLDLRINDAHSQEEAKLTKMRKSLHNSYLELHNQCDELRRAINSSDRELAIKGTTLLHDTKKMMQTHKQQYLHIKPLSIELSRGNRWNVDQAALLQTKEGYVAFNNQPKQPAGVQMPQKQGVHHRLSTTMFPPLTAAMLAASPPCEQKQMLGERLFPLIHEMYPEVSGKITGMLLELTNTELLHMLESSESLVTKVEEALAVLRVYRTKHDVTQ